MLGVVIAALLAAGPGAEAAPEAGPPSVHVAAATQGGMLWLRPNPDALQRLGVRRAVEWPANTEWALPLAAHSPIAVELGDGAPTRLLGGAVDLGGFSLLRADGTRTPPLRLEPALGDTLDWRAVDARGNTWFSISHGMRSPDVAAHGLTLFTADVRSGAALAAFSGQGEAGLLIGNARLQFPLPAPKAEAAPKSCAAPNWPGTPGFVTDVHLTAIDTLDVLRCRRVNEAGACDGPGGVEGEMVIVPSATLRNSTAANASEVPWYTKFTGPPQGFPPYGNDQHPYLVWNLYRVDAEGNLEQVARSGLKHAFATANQFCSEPCSNSHILGRGCQDLYDAGSNDFAFALAPRAEVIPATGQWGRCGSVYDDIVNASGAEGCDGSQDMPPADDLYRNRLVVRESAVDPALNRNATFYIDAWYVVRDDRAIYNTMGSRTLAPRHANGAWTPGPAGPFVTGAVLDRWLASAPEGTATRRLELATAEGTVAVGTRVRRLPDGRWRYDYAVMNFDFSRPVTTGAEPNLRVLRNLGLSGVAIDLAGGATVAASQFRDGDADAGNDWTAAIGAGQAAWSTTAATLDWGRLASFSLVSEAYPGTGEVRLAVAEAGTPASHGLSGALVPDGGAKVFADGLE